MKLIVTVSELEELGLLRDFLERRKMYVPESLPEMIMAPPSFTAMLLSGITDGTVPDRYRGWARKAMKEEFILDEDDIDAFDIYLEPNHYR